MICCRCSRFSVSDAALQHSFQCGVMSGSNQGQSKHCIALKGSDPPDAPAAASAPLAGSPRAVDPAEKKVQGCWKC